MRNGIAYKCDGVRGTVGFHRCAHDRGQRHHRYRVCWRVGSPDGLTVTPVLSTIAKANGVALSPDGKLLWATESGSNRLHRVELATASTDKPLGTAIPYRFIGPAPDSMRADADGHVQAMEHGRKKVRFYSNVNLVNLLEQEEIANKAGHLAESLLRLDLVILDELGYLPFIPSGGALLFHLLSKSYERTSMIITTNLSFSEWNQVFGEPSVS